ncbi:MAG: REP-associated tyrosine transposase, partial [Bacteroidota bacterium]
MPRGYQIDKEEERYFLTSTIVGWIDLFIRGDYKKIIAESLNYCIDQKGLEVNAYVIMSSHLHIIAKANENNLSKVIGEFKKFTSNKLIQQILTNKESRREWMEPIFRTAGANNPKNKFFQIWKNGNHAEQIISPYFAGQKIGYIHANPVKEGIVTRPQ